MARQVEDKEFKFKILQHIKQKCMENGGPVPLSLRKIALAIGAKESDQQKVLYNLDWLIKRGNVEIVEKGEGARPNVYRFVNDSAQDYINDVKTQTIEDIQKNMDLMTSAMNGFYQTSGAMAEKIVALTIENQNLKEAILSLKMTGYTVEGYKQFTANAESQIPLLIDQLNSRNQEAAAAGDK